MGTLLWTSDATTEDDVEDDDDPSISLVNLVCPSLHSCILTFFVLSVYYPNP
jgi:hypothetical protein